ncbi:hypothetical protein [Hyalangium rubrum]|uniref:Cytochrome c domain-containing protein n=1 Tax=Hyalangium rubrum TaxID=3103134 RepID=A0ABU5HI05_9BACT|nr:hypothetical protein [Hyalangium sp. s54d21]MDY7233102.1 hypothetical protein [Hyalangium sp. s54d21]
MTSRVPRVPMFPPVRRLALLGALLALAACGSQPPSTPEPGPSEPLPPVPTNPVPEAVAYPESLLCPEASGADPRCGAPFVPANALPSAELEARYAAGMAAWRHEGTRGACAGCHSPDAIELARVGYTDADLRRRALSHVDEEKANALVGLIHVQRQRYEMKRLLHPGRFRPLQPAYEPFAATTPGLSVHEPSAQSERDGAFMDSLVNERKLLWATGRIDSLEKARQAYDELLAIDLRQLRLGLPFDHLSEDGYHGQEHRSVFEWFPDMATSPRVSARDEWYRRVDAYLAAPGDRTLWGYYDAIGAMTECNPDLGGANLADYPRACEWMRLKYRSLQVFQHMLREGTHRYPDFLVDERVGSEPVAISAHLEKVIARNPIWETGDYLRIQPLARRLPVTCDAGAHPCTVLPPVVDQSIHEEPSYTEARLKQSEVFQQTWFVMSFLRDPALLYEGESFATFIGDYLESVLLPQYDVHHAFIVAKMAVEKSAAREWMEAPGFRAGTGKIASVRTFSFKQLRDNFSPPPAGDRRRAVHDRMFANFARMFIYLVEDDLRKTGEIFDRDEVLYAVRFMRTWIQRLEGAEDAQLNARVLAIESLARSARELRTEANRTQNPGTGLQPNGRWAEFAAPYGG